MVGSGADGGGDGVVAVTGAANPVLSVADAASPLPPPPQRGGNYSNHVSVTKSLLQVINLVIGVGMDLNCNELIVSFRRLWKTPTST